MQFSFALQKTIHDKNRDSHGARDFLANSSAVEQIWILKHAHLSAFSSARNPGWKLIANDAVADDQMAS